MEYQIEIGSEKFEPLEIVVEEIISDGGVRRTIFIDCEARERANEYVSMMKLLHRFDRRRFEVVSD